MQWWMARVAYLLRKEGFNASAAQGHGSRPPHQALAAIRQQPVAGIGEMKEAVLAVFCEGNEEPLQLIEEQLVIGNEVGEVLTDILQIPLQKDLESRIRSLRLAKAFRSAVPETKELDLRKANHLDISHLLHQLNVLEIPWGKVLEAPENRLGSFHENWRLEWLPEYVIKVIEAACGAIPSTAPPPLHPETGGRNRRAILADRAVPARRCWQASPMPSIPSSYRIEDAASLTRDIYYLMDALPVLPILPVMAIPGRRTWSRSVPDPAYSAAHLHHYARCRAPHRGRTRPGVAPADRAEQPGDKPARYQELSPQQWIETLDKIAPAGGAHPLIRASAPACCSTGQYPPAPETARLMRFALSTADEAQSGALWLEGFLYGSGTAAAHPPAYPVPSSTNGSPKCRQRTSTRYSCCCAAPFQNLRP
ncbi:MAG: hypothetical protein H6559_18885 [Lewinellaceae bacterium]|nr:hypothetical protein [Lewinellaceae bacterium]